MTPTYGPGNQSINPVFTDPLALTRNDQRQTTGTNTISPDAKIIDICINIGSLPTPTGNYTIWYNFQIFNSEPNTPIVQSIYQGALFAGDSNGQGNTSFTFEWPNGQQFWLKAWFEVDYDNGAGGFQPVGSQPTVFTDTQTVQDPAYPLPNPPTMTDSIFTGS